MEYHPEGHGREVCSPESHEGFGKAKCKVLPLAWGKPQYQYRLGVERIESSSAKKSFGELVDEGLDMSCQWAPATQKAKCVLGHIKVFMVSRSREVILPRYSALMGSHLEYCICSSVTLSIGKTQTVGASPEENHKNNQRGGALFL